MAARKKITEKPKVKPYTGLLIKRADVDFTPHLLLDRLNAPKENRPVFKIIPYTIDQRHSIEADDSRVKALVSEWAAEKRYNVNDISLGGDVFKYTAYLAKFSEFADSEMRDEITRKCIVGFSFVDNGENIDFVKDENGYLDISIFSQFPKELINEIAGEIRRISNLSFDDILPL